MWVAPRAEMDPSAVSVKAEGHDLAVEAVARRYMPEGVVPPPGIVVGRASLTASMQVWGPRCNVANRRMICLSHAMAAVHT